MVSSTARGSEKTTIRANLSQSDGVLLFQCRKLMRETQEGLEGRGDCRFEAGEILRKGVEVDRFQQLG